MKRDSEEIAKFLEDTARLVRRGDVLALTIVVREGGVVSHRSATVTGESSALEPMVPVLQGVIDLASGPAGGSIKWRRRGTGRPLPITKLH